MPTIFCHFSYPVPLGPLTLSDAGNRENVTVVDKILTIQRRAAVQLHGGAPLYGQDFVNDCHIFPVSCV